MRHARCLGSKCFAAYEFVPVGRHHGDVFRGDVEVDTVHHGTEFIICRGKQGAVDATQHNQSGNVYNSNGIVGESHRARIFIGILAHEAVFTVGVLNQDLESICVDLERKRLFGQFLQRIEQGLRSNGKEPSASLSLTSMVVSMDLFRHRIR